MGLAGLGTALSLGVAPLAACDPVWLPITRPAGISFFVALALADTLRDGQKVQLLRVNGAASELDAREAIVVPWAYGPDCRPIAWSARLAWIPPGTRGAMTGRLRPRDGWLDGVPTFDVEMAWREPLWILDDPRWPHGGSGSERLTPEEFLGLYAALPEAEQLERYPDKTAARVRDWEHRHQQLADRAPARTILDNLYRAAAEQARRSSR